ncbi:MAG TPA: hypothetical protein VJ603_07320 [Paucimonas sp.]|nr:hypothetical protein [Paucimonas sp.]HJW55738.1 hypothetical protein [Burkholderiaceae bacterium]
MVVTVTGAVTGAAAAAGGDVAPDGSVALVPLLVVPDEGAGAAGLASAGRGVAASGTDAAGTGVVAGISDDKEGEDGVCAPAMPAKATIAETSMN